MVCDCCTHPLQSIFQVLSDAGPAYLHTKCYVGFAGYMNTMDALEQVVLFWWRMCARRQKTVGRAIMFVRRWQRDEAFLRWAQEALEALRVRFACWREEMRGPSSPEDMPPMLISSSETSDSNAVAGVTLWCSSSETLSGNA